MEKNFLNITPESGNGNQDVTINAKANISLEDREEMLRINSLTGKEASVRITQDGVPFMANIGAAPTNIFTSDTRFPIEITFSKTTWDSEGIPTTQLIVSNTEEDVFQIVPYFQLLIRKDIVDELLPPGEHGNPAMYTQITQIDPQNPLITYPQPCKSVSFNQITIKGLEYYTAAAIADGIHLEDFFMATIGLCYEAEEVELFRLCTQKFDIYFTGSNVMIVKRGS